MSLGSRLKELRSHKKISRKALAKQIGVTEGAIGHWETDRSSPPIDTLVEIADILGCSLNYLFQDELRNTDEGFTTTVTEQKYLNMFRVLPSYIQKGLEILLDYFYKYKIKSDEDSYDRVIELPTLANVQLDKGIKLSVVIGEAMEPLFKDGDVVIVEPATVLRDGDTGLFNYNGKTIIRRFENNNLFPVNNLYDVIKVNRKNPVEIIGKVTGKI